MKRSLLMISVFLTAACLTGCVDVGDFELTQSEEEQVVDYCADLLLKYDKNHSSNIVDTSLARELQARVDAIKEMNAQLAAEEVSENKASGGDSGGEKSEKKDRFAPTGEQDLAAALGQSGFNVSYKSMEACQSYSAQSGDYFTLDASPGRQLLVFHFDITNTSDRDSECNFLGSGVSFKMIMNGSDVRNALTTLLSNEMSTVDEVLSPGETFDAVLVLETDPGYEDEISSVSLQAAYGGNISVIPLK